LELFRDIRRQTGKPVTVYITSVDYQKAFHKASHQGILWTIVRINSQVSQGKKTVKELLIPYLFCNLRRFNLQWGGRKAGRSENPERL